MKNTKPKKRMLTSSLKAKGRNLCKQVKEELHKAFPEIQDKDIKVTSSGETGEDLQFSPHARTILPISIECKKHNKFAIYKHYKQAQSNCGEYEPIVIIEQNHSTPLAIVDLNFLIKLLTKITK